MTICTSLVVISLLQGLTMDLENLESFKEAFENQASHLTEDQLTKKV